MNIRNRKWFSIATKTIALLMIGSCVIAAAKKDAEPGKKYTGPKKRIAVMGLTPDMVDQSEKSQFIQVIKTMHQLNDKTDVGQRIVEMLTTALVQTGRFTVVERAGIGDIATEQEIGEKMGNEQTRAQKGNVQGAQILVRAAVTEFVDKGSETEGGIGIPGVGVIGARGKESRVVIDVRMYDASTSVILYSEKATGTSKSSGVGGTIQIGNVPIGLGKSNNDPIEKATRNALENAVGIICGKMESVPWEGKVADVSEEGGQCVVTINRGSNDGLNEGDTVKLYKAGKEYVDPDTGLKKNRKPTFVCDAKLTSVDTDSAEMTVDKNCKIAYKDIVRISDSK